MIAMCKEIAASLVNTESKEEKQTVYDSFKDEIEKFDRRPKSTSFVL